MTREAFDQLVRRVEARFAQRPAALRWRVVLFAAMGYAGLLIWLGIVLLLSAGFFVTMYWADLSGKIVCGLLGSLILFGGGYAVLRALLVRVPDPTGRAVTRSEVPELFAVLEELRAALQSPPFDRVLIEPVCNAAVVQVPRLGFFGWSRNYLLLGLPLLDGLSPGEMRAVLAHEFTHLSRKHGRLTHWLYRLRCSWERIFEQFSTRPQRHEFSLRPLVLKFVNWFWPRFNAQAFVLSRAQEYEADAQSARLAGQENAASALMRLSILSHHLEDELWPAIFQLANEQPEPPDNVFQRLRDGLRAGPPAVQAAKWLEEGLQTTSTNSNTHPCLTERLRALAVLLPRDALQSPPPSSAADTLLGASADQIRADVQKLWARQIAEHWRGRHARAGALRHRLNSLEQTAPAREADADRLWDKAVALLDLEGGKAAMPVLQQVVALRPDHAPARFHLGRLLLEDKSAEGVAQLQRAMELDEQCVPQACALLHNHYQLLGETAQLRELDARMDRYDKALAASHAERREVSAKDKFIAHGLADTELQKLRDVLAGESNVTRADLARKELTHFPAQRLFVLCVHTRRPWHGFANHEADRALVNRLSSKIQLPGRLMVFSSSGNFRALARKLAALPGVEVFRRAS
jgi:Zn-dependent protease with chaperone function